MRLRALLASQKRDSKTNERMVSQPACTPYALTERDALAQVEQLHADKRQIQAEAKSNLEYAKKMEQRLAMGLKGQVA